MSRISDRVIILFCVGVVLLMLLQVCRAKGAGDNEPNLLELAMKKFPTLTKDNKEVEKLKKLFHAVVNGEVADYSDKSGKNNDPNEAKDRDPNTGVLKWDPNTRVIRAECIAWLCTDPQASAMVTHKGIRVKGARIDGRLDLSDARISFPLKFEKSAVPVGFNLQNAELRNLYLVGTHTGPIYGDGMKVEGSVFLRYGFKSEGEVRLTGATIGGSLSCVDGQFIKTWATALSADGADIRGSVYLCYGFKAEGVVNLIGATIGGNLVCNDSQFINKGAIALSADGADIKGGVFLHNGFKAEGEVRLVSATIGRNLECLRGQFINKGAIALSTAGVNVQRNVLLCGGFKAEGEVILIGATIDGYLIWTDVNSPNDVTLYLRSASIRGLWDDKDSWPAPNNLFLHGLVYNEIYEGSPRDAESRIDWLQRQKGFWPQPYEQLAAVLRKGGQDEDARKILIAKNKDKARLTKLTFTEKCWYRVFGRMIGYGYRPLKALWGVLFFVVLGWILFGIGYYRGFVTPQSESAYIKQNTGTAEGGTETRQLSDVYPRFNFLVYSFDTFVPLIDLHQAKYWLPNAKRGFVLLRIKGFSLHTGGLLRLYLWIHLTMGWVLSMLLVVGLTGLVRT